MENKILIKKPKLALALRIIGLITGICGITLHMMVNTLLDTGFMVKHNLAYFTIQTNIISTVIFAVLIIKTIITYIKTKKLEISHINPKLHLAATLYITITMTVYWLILAPMTGMPKNFILLSDAMLLHTILPLIAIIDTLLFFKHGSVKKQDSIKWLSYPILYYISVIIISKFIKEPYYSFKFGDKMIELLYPYPFIDPQFMGIGGVIIAVTVAVIIFTLLSLLYIYLDNRIANRINSPKV